jgi:hypothetical protein
MLGVMPTLAGFVAFVLLLGFASGVGLEPRPRPSI